MKSKKITEAIDKHGVPQHFHKDKEAEIHNVSTELQDYLPPATTQKYLEYVGSESYRHALQQVQRYTGHSAAADSVPGMINAVLNAVSQIAAFEDAHKETLCKLAKSLVLNLPEFELVKYQVASGFLKIEASLGEDDIDLEKLKAEDLQTGVEMEAVPDENDPLALTPVEIANETIARDYNDEKMRRRVAGIINTGNAANKFYLFNLVKAELDAIDPRLISLYGIASSYIHLIYFATPNMGKVAADGSGDSEQGSCNIDKGTGAVGEPEYTIRAAATTFPFLVHEIVKCIWNYLSIEGVHSDVLQGEKLPDEIIGFITGPHIYRMFTRYIPQDQQHLLPMIHSYFLKLPAGELKAVLAGKEEAAAIMGRVIHAAKIEWKAYKTQHTEWLKTVEDNKRIREENKRRAESGEVEDEPPLDNPFASNFEEGEDEDDDTGDDWKK